MVGNSDTPASASESLSQLPYLAHCSCYGMSFSSVTKRHSNELHRVKTLYRVNHPILYTMGSALGQLRIPLQSVSSPANVLYFKVVVLQT